MNRFRWVLVFAVLVGVSVSLVPLKNGQSVGAAFRRIFGARPEVTLLVTTDLDCNWKLDGRLQGRLHAKESTIVPSTLGQHLLEARTVDGQDTWKGVLEFRAPEQYVAAFSLLDVRQKRLGNYLPTAGVVPAAPVVSPNNVATAIPSAMRSISNQIDQIVEGGHYTNLPQPPSSGAGRTSRGDSSLSIENQTAFELTVLMSGPVEKSLSINPGGTRTLEVPAGSYRILGRVAAPNVLPFVGTHSYSPGMSYPFKFYIQ
jgi:hypothetical protein